MLAGAEKARDAVGFHVVSDPKTGAKIGAPTKLLGARAGARLDFASSADADLSALYARLSAGTQTRKVAYKAIEARRFLCRFGAGGAFEVLYPVREERAGEPADPRLHLRLSRFARPLSSTGSRSRSPIRLRRFPGAAAAPAEAAGRQLQRAAESGSAPPQRPAPSRPQPRSSSRPARR